MLSSLFVSIKYKNKTIIWHELAKHNNIMKKLPSIFWYNIVAKLFFHNTRIVARSNNAQLFIKKYCNNVSEQYIDHGVNLEEFKVSKNKEKQFVVISQLIHRKHIDGIINIFSQFIEKGFKEYKLIIIGSGDKKSELEKMVKDKQITKNVEFKGQLTHRKIVPILSNSKALIVNTEKDNSMLTIVESIATATPILTTDIPYNCHYIIKNNLGVVSNKITIKDFYKIIEKNNYYINNCIEYRYKISNEYHIKQFLEEIKYLNNN